MTAAKRRWKQPDKRMEAAVRMREAGWALRKIADHLGVTHTTVRRDLAQYEKRSVEHLLEHLGRSGSEMFQGDVP